MRVDTTLPLAVALLLASCSVPPTHVETSPISLEQIPAGDRAWRAALKAASGEVAREELCVRIRSIAEGAPHRWEPQWAAARCSEAKATPSQMVALFRPILGLARAEGSGEGIASVGGDLAWAAFESGDATLAESTFEAALHAASSLERHDLQAFLQANYAGFLVDRGRLSESRQRLAEAATAFGRMKMQAEQRAMELNGAIVQRELGNVQSARLTLQALLSTGNSPSDQRVIDTAQLALGNLHLALGELTKAQQRFESISEKFAGLSSRAHLGLARIALIHNDVDQAERHLRQSIEIMNEPKHAAVLHARALLAEVELRRNRFAQAISMALEVAAVAQASAAQKPAWTAHWIAARAMQAQGRVNEAVAALHRAIEIIESQSVKLDPSGEGIAFLRERAEPYVSLALTLGTGSRPDLTESFEVIGRLHARGLRHALSDSEAPESIALRELQRSLEHDEALIAVALGDEEGIAISVERDRAFGRRLPGRRALLPLIERMREDLIAGRSSDVAAALSQQLLAPMLSELNTATRLYLVADRELSRIPFVALPDPASPSEPLGARREIALMPYAGAPPRWSAERGPVLLAGAPRFEAASSWRELPWSAYELSHLRTLLGDSNSTLITADAFTAQSLLDASLHKFRTIHLATHAVASTLDPTECGIIASHDERLGIDRVMRLPLTDALVVLSACRTGEGEAIPGQGIVGLTWATMLAGARGVIASQWSVDDAASARLMLALHRQLKAGIDPVHALALAQREIRATQKSPAIWAAHMVIVRAAARAGQDRRAPREKTSPDP